MADLRTLVRDEMERAGSPSYSFDDLGRRRVRKRRNQRIAAGVVGLAVFVAAVWIVTSAGTLDRTQTVVPGGAGTTGPAETGPMQTGPAETGPTVTGPVIGNTGDPSSVGFGGLPPEGATPSKPLRGELVMKDSGEGLPWHAVNVFADGRLIWSRQVEDIGAEGGPANLVPRWIEQRLTPEGVELLRSGAVPLGGQFENPAQGLPASAWEDRTLRPFVPWRYAACLSGDPPHYLVEQNLRLEDLARDFLPAEAQEVLRRSPWRDASAWGQPCREVTLEDARVLVEILSGAGFELIRDAGSGPGGFWVVTDPNGNQPPRDVGIEFWAVLPHGSSDYPVGF